MRAFSEKIQEGGNSRPERGQHHPICCGPRRTGQGKGGSLRAHACSLSASCAVTMTSLLSRPPYSNGQCRLAFLFFFIYLFVCCVCMVYVQSVCKCMCLCACMQGPEEGIKDLLSLYTLFYDIRSLTEPEASCFTLDGWPPSS